MPTGSAIEASAAVGVYRNVALRRAAYHSSAANYNETGHLVTDGILSVSGAGEKVVFSAQWPDADSPSVDERLPSLFDGKTDTKYNIRHNTAWMQVFLPESRAEKGVKSYIVASANDSPDRDPRSWQLQGSNNGTGWTTLDTQTNVVWSSRYQVRTFTLSTAAAYAYYRLNITANYGGTGADGLPRLQLSEWDLLDPGGSTLLRDGGIPSFNSAWASATAGQEYIYIDLGADSAVDKVTLYWADENYAAAYDIQISGDAKSWTTVYSKTGGGGDIETCTFPEKQARYVRLLCKKSSADGYCLSEMEVWGRNDLSYGLAPLPAPQADGTQYLTGGNWRVERVSETSAVTGAALSTAGYDDKSWLPATVPGTVLTSYLRAGAIPDPNIADQQLQISDSYFTTDFWYRNEFTIPAGQAGKRTWLNFNAINWKADVWFNGVNLGKIEGAFIRGRFDITALANYGGANYLAVYIHANDNPGPVDLKDKDNPGKNGGVLGRDNPTIHASIGWNWIPTIRGRNIGIYGDVFLNYSGNATIVDPWTVVDFNTANISADKTTVSTASVAVKGAVKNTANTAQTVSVSGAIQPGNIPIPVQSYSVAAGQTLDFSIPVTMSSPKLWWPNTYGDQFLYTANLEVKIGGAVSDAKSFNFGVRKFTYQTTNPMIISCNGSRIVCKGGNWGMDDANLAATPADYDVKVRLHAEANFVMIRNWVGMTGNKAFYDACDKYGLLIWDDFWLAHPGDGPDPDDPAMFIANAKDKVSRNRYHASLALYCGRNEGDPPAVLDAAFREMTRDLDGTRHYIPHSASGTVSGFGPYASQDPAWYFNDTALTIHSERGFSNVPAYESLLKMLTDKYAWPINDVWGLHDFCGRGTQGADAFESKMQRWYGPYKSLKEFARIAQMVDYECLKAMFEAVPHNGRHGMLMWMSMSAWPSMVYQIHDYYYDTNGGYFGIRKANQPINAYWANTTRNGADKNIWLANTTPLARTGLKVMLGIYDINGTLLHSDTKTLDIAADSTKVAMSIPTLSHSGIRFIKTEVRDSADKLIADNFYWMNTKEAQNYAELMYMPKAQLETSQSALADVNGNKRYAVTVKNTSSVPALMIRLKTLDSAGRQMLPVYYDDNYFSLMPGESKVVTLEIDSRFSSGTPTFAVECWNAEQLTVPARERKGVSYTYPRTYNKWMDGLLTGNGEMGAIVFGNPLNDTIIYNHRLFNLAATRQRSFNTISQPDLKRIRDACIAENWKLANDLAFDLKGWQSGGEGNKHPGFAMNIKTPAGGQITDYARTCDYTTGEISVNWTDGRGDWARTMFISRKDNVAVQRLTKPSGGGKLDCAIKLEITPEMGFPNGTTHTSTATLKSATEAILNIRVLYASPAATGNAGYESVTRVVAQGGTLSVDAQDGTLTVTGADSVILLTRMDKYYKDCQTEWAKETIQKALASVSADYNTLMAGQKATHGEIFNRVTLDLGASDKDRALPNEVLLKRQQSQSAPNLALFERLFDAGRYHYLCASGDLGPPDLLGIWAGDCNAGWGGFYHLDANLNLQIAGGISGNMPETMEGYFGLMEAWQEDFATNASKLLGCRGFIAAGNTPGATTGLLTSGTYYYPYQYATAEVPWLLYPFWEYYQTTGDKDFLENRLYPWLKGMGELYEDFLVETDANGKYIFAGSVSPENQPSGVPYSLVNNASFDIAGAKFALNTLVEVCGLLGKEQGDNGGVKRWQAIIDKLPPYLVNKDGALSEYSWPSLKDRDVYSHRHSSHLLNVWPFREITPESADQALFSAALTAYKKKDAVGTVDRGSSFGGNGHGSAHAALIAATLKDGESALHKLLRFSKEDFYYDGLGTSHDRRNNNELGTFCTDIAHVYPAIVIEMLMQSHDYIDLLPALPAAWSEGAVSGLLARGNFEVGMEWNQRVLQKASVKSLSGNACTLNYPGLSECKVTKASDGQTVSFTKTGFDTITFPTQAGETYLIAQAGENVKFSDPREFLRANVDNLHSRTVLNVTKAPAEIGNNGAYLDSFMDGSYAAALGMRKNDIITAINGQQVTDTEKLLQIYDAVPNGAAVALRIWRESRYIEIKFTKAASDSYLRMPGQIEAEAFDGFSGTGLNIQDSGTGKCIGNINPGYWVRYDNVYFGSPLTAIYASAAKDTGTMQIMVRLDSATAAPIATLDIKGTREWNNGVQTANEWHTYYDYIAAVTGAIPEGVHAVYLTFTGSVNLDFFGMTGAQTALPDPPAGLTAVKASSPTAPDGRITGVTADMEYRPAGGSTYTACTGNTIAGLLPGTYHVRFKAAGGAPASADTVVTVEAADAPAILYGDIDGKNGVTITDARLLLQHLVGKYTIPEDRMVYAKVNNGVTLTVSDARLILQKLVDKIDKFPVEK